MTTLLLRLLAGIGVCLLPLGALGAATEPVASDFGSPGTAMASGFFHTVVLSSDGTVFTFGRGARGQLGHGDTEARAGPVAIEHEVLADHSIVAVAAGGEHTVLLSEDGTVFTFGSGADGQLGHGDRTDRLVPARIEHENLSGHTITGIAAGASHTVLLASDGTVFTFGLGWHGRLGHGDESARTVPVPIGHGNIDGHTITGIAAGREHTLLVSSGGAVFSFGRGREGGLGHGDTANRLVPVRIEHENLSGKTIVEAGAGFRFSVLLATDGTVFSFGRGNDGQLGLGDTAGRLVPTPISDEAFDGNAITGIAAGAAHTVLHGGDTVFTFGAGDFGRLGHGDKENRNVPTPIGHDSLSGKSIAGAVAGGSHTAVLTSAGEVLTFGMGMFGQLGHSDTEHRLVPLSIPLFRNPGYWMVTFDLAGTGTGAISIGGTTFSEFPTTIRFRPDQEVILEAVPGPGSFFDRWLGDLGGAGEARTLTADADKRVVAAFGSDALVLWNDVIGADETGAGVVVGLLYAAGPEDDPFTYAFVSGEGDDDNARFRVEGNELQTADTLTADGYSVRVRATSEGGRSVERMFSISVVSGNVAPKVAAGRTHTVLLASDGTVFTVGWGWDGQLGHGNEQSLTVPAPIEHDSLSGRMIVDVAAGNGSTFLLSSDGTVFAFGRGSNGRLGHGDTEDRLVPVPIEHENLSGHRIVRVAAGGGHTALLSSDGTVFTFGGGWNGVLGHGDTAPRDVPTPIVDPGLAGYTITGVAAGFSHTVLWTTDGSVFTFGVGSDGRLGHGDTEDRLSPARIEHENLAGHTIVEAAAGGTQTVLLSSNGTLFTFGSGREGQLGHGDTENRLVPTPVAAENLSVGTIAAMAAGSSHTALLSDDGSILTFGSGRNGRLGHGDTADRLIPVPVDDPAPSGRKVTGLAAGSSHTVLVSSDGTVVTFGRGDDGQLGQGDHESRLRPERIEFLNLLGKIVLRVDVSGPGRGEVLLNGEAISGSPHYLLGEPGEEVSLEAAPDEDSFLDRWAGDLTGTDPATSLLLEEHGRLTAVFGVKALVIRTHSIAAERAVPGATVSLLHAVGPQQESFVFTLVPGEGDDDNARFTIDGRELRAAEELPAGVYSVRLRATNESGLVLEDAFAISVVMVETKVAVGGTHTVILSPDGVVFTFGSGDSGQLGHGDTENRSTPTGIQNAILAEPGIVEIAAGGAHTVLLSADGTVFTFGSGWGGALGQGDFEDRLEPTPVEHENLDGHTIVQVAAGNRHTLLLSADGTVFSFGGAALGRDDTFSGRVPAPVDGLDGYTIVGIAAGGQHSVLRSADGSVLTFGRGYAGQLGHGDSERRNAPERIEHENLAGHSVAGVAVGGDHTILVASDGTVFTFGWGGSGQLGHGDTDSRFVPVPLDHEDLAPHTITGVAGGRDHTILFAADGTAFAFGEGFFGQLGHGGFGDRLEPEPIVHVNLTGHTIVGAGAGSLSGRTPGGEHSALLSADGTVFTFGANESGQLGHDDTVNRRVPTPIRLLRKAGHPVLRIVRLGDGEGMVLVDGEPVSEFPIMIQAVPGSEISIEAMAGGGSYFDRWTFEAGGTDPSAVIALDEDREIGVVFGSREIVVWRSAIGADRTGAGAVVSPLYADAAEGESVDFALVSGEGDEDNASFSVAGGELRTTDSLEPGEYSIRLAALYFGAGSVSREESVTISVVPGAAEPKIDGGSEHTVYLSADGTVFTFGRGGEGQLGHGDEEDRRVPIPIEHDILSGHSIVDVAAGGWHTVLLAADGTVFTFGAGDRGQLGHGDEMARAVPTAIENTNLDGHTITEIAAGTVYTVLTSSDGTVFTFGSGAGGSLGHGDELDRAVPTAVEHQILSGYTIRRVAAGTGGRGGGRTRTFNGQHTVLVSLNGTVFSFGANGSGQLGHGDTEPRLVPERIETILRSGHAIADAAAGGVHTILRSSEGAVFTFGQGGTGALGHGYIWDRVLEPVWVDHEALRDVSLTAVAAGGEHSVVVSEDGSVWTFGANGRGQLGLGDRGTRLRRLFPELLEHESVAGRAIVGVAAGIAHTVSFAEDGTVLTFGGGESGQLGHGNTESRLVPTPIEFFRLPGHRMYLVETFGDGTGSVVIEGETISEFPVIGQREPGSEVLIEAVPGENSQFAGWAGDADGTEPLLTVTLATDSEITAVFNLQERVRFDAAMAEAGLNGDRAEPDADPFGDGVKNLLRYAFNLHTSQADYRRLERGGGGRAGLPAVGFGDGSERALIIEYVRRKDSGLIYTPRVSTDLDTWQPADGEAEITEINADWERVVVRIPLASSVERAFGSVEVTLP